MDNLYPNVKHNLDILENNESLNLYDDSIINKFSERLMPLNTIYKLKKNIDPEDVINLIQEYCTNKISVKFYNNIIKYFRSNLKSNTCFNVFEQNLKNMLEDIEEEQFEISESQ